MKKQEGFTLVELMVTVAIIGILMATGVPVYQTWQQRARGSEAAITVKQIMEAQIMYYLDNDKFYPPDDTSIDILHGQSPQDENVIKVTNNLNIVVPTDHFLNYSFIADNAGNEEFTLVVSSFGGVDIFRDMNLLSYTLDKTGKISDPWSIE